MQILCNNNEGVSREFGDNFVHDHGDTEYGQGRWVCCVVIFWHCVWLPSWTDYG